MFHKIGSQKSDLSKPKEGGVISVLCCPYQEKGERSDLLLLNNLNLNLLGRDKRGVKTPLI